jgi:hypothetical protein
MPEDFQRILKPQKDWSTLTDETALQAVASWNWLHTYFRDHWDEGNGEIGASRWSKMAACLTILRQKSSGTVYASMGNRKFAALLLQLVVFEVNGLRYFKFHISHKVCEFAYFTNPLDWEALPYTAIRLADHGIVMQQHADGPMPLMRHCLRQRQNGGMTIHDKRKFLQLVNIQVARGNHKIADIHLALAKHFLGEDDIASASVRQEAALYQTAQHEADNTDELLLQDPLVDMVYDDMDGEDKGEFREIGIAKQKRRVTAASEKWKKAQESANQEKRHPFKRGRPKGAKGRNAGKGKGRGGVGKGKVAAVDPVIVAEAEAEAAQEEQEAAEAAQEEQVAVEANGKGRGQGEGKGKAKGKGRAKGRGNDGAADDEANGKGRGKGEGKGKAKGKGRAKGRGNDGAADDGAPVAHTRSVNSYDGTGPWEDVFCRDCGRSSALKKLHIFPGNRDSRTYHIKCYDFSNGRYFASPPKSIRKCVSMMEYEPDVWIRDWVWPHRTCCQ